MGVDQGSRRTLRETKFRMLTRSGLPRDGLGPLPPPPPMGCISEGPLPVTHKLTTAPIKHLIPCHKHENILVQSSLHFYNHTSWFKGIFFKWSSGNFNMAPFCLPR